MLKVGLKEPAEFMVIPRFLYSLTFSSNLLSEKIESFLFTLHFFWKVMHLVLLVSTLTLHDLQKLLCKRVNDSDRYQKQEGHESHDIMDFGYPGTTDHRSFPGPSRSGRCGAAEDQTKIVVSLPKKLLDKALLTDE